MSVVTQTAQAHFDFATRDLMDMGDEEFYWSVTGVSMLREDVRKRYHALPRVKREAAELRRWHQQRKGGAA